MSDSFSKYIGFFIFLIICLLFRFIANSVGRKNKKEAENFLNAEHEANFSRAHEIPDEMFYHPDTGSLPDNEYGDGDEFAKLNAAKQKVYSSAKSNMLRLNPPMKNIEIKQKFGAVNLEKITNYEVSYDQYIRSLSTWAEELIKLGFYEDAKQVLLVCMEMDSLIFLPYSLICDIYEKEKDISGLKGLEANIRAKDIIANDEILSGKIIRYIYEKLSVIENS